jgi:hypothetical protein
MNGLLSTCIHMEMHEGHREMKDDARDNGLSSQASLTELGPTRRLSPTNSESVVQFDNTEVIFEQRLPPTLYQY